MSDDLTVKRVIKLVLTKVCTQMNLNEKDSEELIEHISNNLSPEQNTYFTNLTAELNSHRWRNDYNIEDIILDGCDFSTGLTEMIKEYIDKIKNYDSSNVFIRGGSFP
ncbi:17744_t:CDS:1 [Cetraspora pellucida]|uniref:17744_t:CDS:1 n=1 Tax=Cetraspora pellucida TaxID=1433469 RepID=A0A9N9AA33_9GLOM|nr:17744_t:CDS:1 [Cetraspora pellucida]